MREGVMVMGCGPREGEWAAGVGGKRKEKKGKERKKRKD